MNKPLTPELRKKLSAVLLMLSSDKDGEVVNAARAITRILKPAGLDWHDLMATIVAEMETAGAAKAAPGAESAKPEKKESTPILATRLDKWLTAVENGPALSLNAASFIAGLRAKTELHLVVYLSPRQFKWLRDLVLLATGELIKEEETTR